MKTISALLIFFLAVGIFVRSYDRKTVLILSAGIVMMLIYLYLA